jgi:hypothetical protein
MQRVQFTTLISIRDSEHFNEVLQTVKGVLEEETIPLIQMVSPKPDIVYRKSEIDHTFGPTIAKLFFAWAEHKSFTAEEGSRTYYWAQDVSDFVHEHEELFLSADEKEERAIREAAEKIAAESEEQSIEQAREALSDG